MNVFDTNICIKKSVILTLIAIGILSSCTNESPNSITSSEQVKNNKSQIENAVKKSNKTPIDNNEISNKDELNFKINRSFKNNYGYDTDSYKTIKLNDVYVIDGDTINGYDSNGNKIKVRLSGIDAPESKQPLGENSKKSLESCIKYSNDINIVVDKNKQTDRYGRYIGQVNASNINCNLRQVENGMAWFYRDYAKDLKTSDAKKLDDAEKYAKLNSFGIWNIDVQPAWEYRKENKK